MCKYNAIIDKYQMAYLTLIINDIIIYLDNKAACYIILLYLSSAFDTLDAIYFLLDLIKLEYTAKYTVGLCILSHLEHNR